MSDERKFSRERTSVAAWSQHVRWPGIDPDMTDWMVDRQSLTQKLKRLSRQFRVQKLRQARALCLADETNIIGAARRIMVQAREVLLRCDGVPVVYAHTIVPLSATASDWPFFSSLGERSLGASLFVDPAVRRGQLEYAFLGARHPLVIRAAQAIVSSGFEQGLWARRCLYRRGNGLLVVTEVFLPSISRLRQPVSG